MSPGRIFACRIRICSPKLKIPGGHVEVEEFLSEVDLPRGIFDQAMKQVTHEDSRLKIVQVSGSELLKRDRF